jgi:carbon storage regulator CsrA
MLVLSRHRDESIIIGDDIVLTIVDIRGDKVRIGIDAPHRSLRPPPGGLRRDQAL